MSFFRDLCSCCFGGADEDEERIIPPNSSNNYHDNQSSGYGSEPRDRQPTNAVPSKPKSAVEEEQDELRRILQRTEQEVIDVSNVDSVQGFYQYGNRMANEYIAAMIKYENMLKEADPKHYREIVIATQRHLDGPSGSSSIALTNSSRSAGNEPTPSSPIAKQPSKSYGSMDELSVNQVKEYLSQSPRTKLISDFSADRQKQMKEAILKTIKAQHQEDLVVHMDI